jgi:hypothetical protein
LRKLYNLYNIVCKIYIKFKSLFFQRDLVLVIETKKKIIIFTFNFKIML